MSKTNDRTELKTQKSTEPKKNKFETKPIINSSMYFSKDGKYLIFEKTEKHLFPASYYMKLIDSEITKSKGEPQ